MTDVAIAIDGEAVAVVRTRRPAGTYDLDGKFVAASPVSSSIAAAVQPASGSQLRDLPEGVRTEANWLLWSRSSIELDDQILHAGITYRVVYVWPRADGGFYRAALGRSMK